MNFIFYITALIGIISSFKVITSRDALNGLLFLTISLLSLASLCFSFHDSLFFASLFLLYALVISASQYFMIKKYLSKIHETKRVSPRVWLGPAIICYFFIFLLAYLLLANKNEGSLSTLLAIQYNALSVTTFLFLSFIFFIFFFESVLIGLFLQNKNATLFFPKLKKRPLK